MLSFVGCARGFVVCVGVGCGVMFVAAGAESLPWGSRLWGCDNISVSGGFPLLLCPFFDLRDEVGELLGFVAVELGCELLLEYLDIFGRDVLLAGLP